METSRNLLTLGPWLAQVTDKYTQRNKLISYLGLGDPFCARSMLLCSLIELPTSTAVSPRSTLGGGGGGTEGGGFLPGLVGGGPLEGAGCVKGSMGGLCGKYGIGLGGATLAGFTSLPSIVQEQCIFFYPIKSRK